MKSLIARVLEVSLFGAGGLLVVYAIAYCICVRRVLSSWSGLWAPGTVYRVGADFKILPASWFAPLHSLDRSYLRPRSWKGWYVPSPYETNSTQTIKYGFRQASSIQPFTLV